MPIYAYRCGSCGHARDVLQKVSDPVLTTCPACGADTFVKQVTAAGFQLKGSGWYATDFRGNGSGAKTPEKAAADGTPGGDAAPAAPVAGPAKAAADKPAAATPASPAAPAPGG